MHTREVWSLARAYGLGRCVCTTHTHRFVDKLSLLHTIRNEAFLEGNARVCVSWILHTLWSFRFVRMRYVVLLRIDEARRSRWTHCIASVSSPSFRSSLPSSLASCLIRFPIRHLHRFASKHHALATWPTWPLRHLRHPTPGEKKLSMAMDEAPSSSRVKETSHEGDAMAHVCAMAKACRWDAKRRHKRKNGTTGGRRMARCRPNNAMEEVHGAFVRDTVQVDVPAHLEALLAALEAKGNVKMDPNERRGMFPLAIPLAKDVQTGEVLALLRWPQPDRSHTMPVVSLHDTCGVTLKAQDATQMLHRMLVEEDVAVDGGKQSSRPVAEAIGYLGAEFYTKGDFARGKLPHLAAYVTKHVGYFPDVCESLVQHHLDKGDTMSAMITVDWYAGRFPHWGSPHVFSAKLYQRLGRLEEARDEARKALLKPWWTLGDNWVSVMKLAEFEDEDAESLHEKIFHLQNQEKLQAKLTNQDSVVTTAEDEAMWVLDKEFSRGSKAVWDSVRRELAAKFKEIGRLDMACFILPE